MALSETETYLFWSYWLLRGLCEVIDGLRIVTQIALAANEDDR